MAYFYDPTMLWADLFLQCHQFLAVRDAEHLDEQLLSKGAIRQWAEQSRFQLQKIQLLSLGELFLSKNILRKSSVINFKHELLSVLIKSKLKWYLLSLSEYFWEYVCVGYLITMALKPTIPYKIAVKFKTLLWNKLNLIAIVLTLNYWKRYLGML